jgi:hypothetical protein
MAHEFWIEDELHAEVVGKFSTFCEAFKELIRLSNIKWMEDPNIPPCVSGEKCERVYQIVERLDNKTLIELPILVINSDGSTWLLLKDSLDWMVINGS